MTTTTATTSTTSGKNIRVMTRRLSSGTLDERNFIYFDSQWKPETKCKENSDRSVTTATSSTVFGDDDPLTFLPRMVMVDDKGLMLQSMINQLSTHEKEVAARSSFAYFMASVSKDVPVTDDERDQAAMAMAARHLRADKGDILLAVQHMKATIQWRQDQHLDELRCCFEESTDQAMSFRTEIQGFVGEKGKFIIQGFDKEHRACWHTVDRHSPEGTQLNHDGCLLAHYYMLERAIACSEASSLKYGCQTQETVVVSVDFAGFQLDHAPNMNTIKELLFCLRDHYPERLFRVYLVDAPLVFRSLWAVIKPFVDAETKKKFQFVTGKNQRSVVFDEIMGSDQCMPYQHPNGELACDGEIDVQKFYSLPFDAAYGGAGIEKKVHEKRKKLKCV